MNELFQDLRFGLRMLMKSPGFTAIAVITLALGIGANTGVFSFVNGMLLRPLGYPDENRLTCLFTANPAAGWSGANVSIPDYQDWSTQNTSFADMGICFSSSYNLTGGEQPERVSSIGASASLLPTLGFEAEIGRTFTPEEDQPGYDHVVLLSHSFWLRYYGGDPSTVGRLITLDDASFTILGVLPARLEQAWGKFDVWTPFAIYDNGGNREYAAYHVYGRLKAGVSVAQAQSEMAGIAARLSESYPETNQGRTAEVKPIIDNVVDNTARLAVASLAAAVAFVLLIACTNVANLLLAKSTGRHREFAIRTTLGASRWRLTRQVLAESLLLALAGAGLGVLLAIWGVDFLVSRLPEDVPRRESIVVDQSVLIFTLFLSLLTTLLFGLLPALRASRFDLNAALKDAQGFVSTGRSRQLGRDALVIGQMALALSLLVCAALMIKSFHLQRTDATGFNAKSLLTMRLRLPAYRYDNTAKEVAFFERALERIRQTPGVTSAAAAHILPFDGSSNYPTVTTEDDVTAGADRHSIVGLSIVTPRYFETMGIPLLSGQDFSSRSTAAVVIVNERFARRHWPDRAALGKRVKFGRSDSAGSWFTIVGVVGNVRRKGLDEAGLGYMYLPHDLIGGGYMAIAARTSGDPLAATMAVRNAIWEIDPDQTLYNIRSMEEIVASNVGVWGLLAGTLSVFAAAALVLTTVGLYGVMSYNVCRRTHEIGVRMALGARTRDVMRLLLRKSALLTLPGLVLGLGLSCVLGQAMKAVMYRVTPTDPTTLIGVSMLLIATALVACYIPARRAIRVDPMSALRTE